jgi:hypothetical protein
MSHYIYTAEVIADENYRSVFRQNCRDLPCRNRLQKACQFRQQKSIDSNRLSPEYEAGFLSSQFGCIRVQSHLLAKHANHNILALSMNFKCVPTHRVCVVTTINTAKTNVPRCRTISLSNKLPYHMSGHDLMTIRT